MGSKLKTSLSALTTALSDLTKGSKIPDFAVKHQVIPAVNRYFRANQIDKLSQIEQAAKLQEFFASPDGKRCIAIYQRSSYNTWAGTAKFLLEVMTSG